MRPATVSAGEGIPRTRPNSYWTRVSARVRADPVVIVCLAYLAAIALCALFAGSVAPSDPFQSDIVSRLRPIASAGFPLGSDELGGDMLSRLIYGGRRSLLMGLLPVITAFIIGTALGTIAAYMGGLVNALIMRAVDVFYAFPSVLLAVAI